jgi:hypothetical protein
MSPDAYRLLADRLLFVETEDCLLPCWYGLRPGMSTAEEIAPAFREALHLPEDYPLVEGSPDEHTAFVEGAWSVQTNSSPEQEAQGIVVTGNFDPQTRLLTHLSFQWGSADHPTTPERILRALGIPDHVLFQVSSVVQGYTIKKSTFFYVEKRTVIDLVVVLPVQQITSGGNFTEWCLDGGGAGYEEDTISVSIGFSPDSLATTAEALIEAWDWSSLEEVFGITPQDLYQHAVQEGEVCLTFLF